MLFSGLTVNSLFNFVKPGPQAWTPRNRFLLRNQFRCGIDSWSNLFHVKELKISELSLSCIVCGEGHPISDTFPKIWPLSAGDEKLIHHLQISILIYGTWSIQFHTWFLFHIEFPHSTSKKPAHECCAKIVQCM
jgi:hypothetical protein